MPKSKPWTVLVEGGDILTHKLRLLDKSPEKELENAVTNGAHAVTDYAEANAPGRGITWDMARPWNTTQKSMEIGPDKEHWYYRFFEFGVQPFEINMISKRTQRGAIDRRRTERLGRSVTTRGRRIKSELRAVKFGTDQIFSVVRPGGFPAKPFLRKAVRDNNDSIADVIGQTFLKAIDALLEGR